MSRYVRYSQKHPPCYMGWEDAKYMGLLWRFRYGRALLRDWIQRVVIDVKRRSM